ncbi:DUF6461 domain-containing protein [Streptomyces sp. NPDC058611]|uniref:DUF6461 domain-containing protein n=1 Tax=unclassified Streptomyces TaxID=2593676 RepID=UPI003651C8F5
MNDGLCWIADTYPFGYSITLCENLTPEEALHRLGAQLESLLPLTRDQAQAIEVHNAGGARFGLPDELNLDTEALTCHGFLRPEADAIVRAGTAGNWAFTIQASISHTLRPFLEDLSHNTRVLAHSTDVNATQSVAYAVNGQTLSAFDPIFPEYIGGAKPSEFPAPAGTRMGPKETLAYVESVFGIGISPETEFQPLPTAALSSRA